MTALTRFGDRAVRFAIPEAAPRPRLLAALRGVRGVRDVVLAEEIGSVVFQEDGRAQAERDVALALDLSIAWDREGPDVARMHEIRVVYDGDDLDAVALTIGKSRTAVALLHSDREYRVAMLGFLPGFAYLRGLPPELQLPRRAPRPRVAPNSVAIAAQYTGIYPFASPGGWHLLGRAVGFKAFGADGAAMAVGDAVRFSPAYDEQPSPPSTAAIAAPPTTPTRPHLEVTRAAGLALLVDGGRPGHMHEGMPPGGPLVQSALARANALADNPASTCGVEVSGSLEVVARGGSLVVADDDGRVDLSEGERHVVSTAGRERVRYLAVAGGVEAPVVLGSRGTLLVARIGALLRRGDRLVPQGAPVGGTEAPATTTSSIAIEPGPDVVHGLPIDALTTHALRVSAASDRTGTRLDGLPLRLPSTNETMGRPSAPMVVGAIELTPSGLVVLGPDHPTTGGYPVVAVIRAASLDAFFSRPIGSELRFSYSG